MRRLGAVLSLFVVGGVFTPASASANVIHEASGRVAEGALELTIRSGAQVPEPRMRVTPQRVRIWFRGMSAVQRTKLHHLHELVKEAKVTSGVADTAVVDIRFRRRLKIAESDVSVAREDNHVRITIHHAALVTPTSSVQQGGAEEGAEAAPPPKAAKAVATPRAPDAEAPKESTLTKEKAAPLDAPKEETTPGAFSQASFGPGMGVLLLLTGLLALTYLVVRYIGQRVKSPEDRPDIGIVACRKIGPKHQLMVVRVLENDYLLSVNGAQTQKIASLKRPADDKASSGVLEQALQSKRKRASAAYAQAETPAMALDIAAAVGDEVEDESEIKDFRKELLRFERASSAPGKSTRGAASLASISGLMQLRERMSK